MRRTQYCGALDTSQVGKSVLLQGWVNRRRDLGGLIFLDLRDRSGLIQIVVEPGGPTFAKAGQLRSEYVVEIAGVVRARPTEQTNNRLTSGAVEVLAERLEVLAEAKTPPFSLDASWRGVEDPTEHVNEDLRLKYRYLDLRRAPMQARLRLRHRVIKAIWDFMDAAGFIQVETPFLTRSTPEGARDFLVPSRLEPGRFYALPQSPQLFKQMLMIAGVDRYFQIARCFRDEDLRADRQPDFTQLDMELSFVDQEDILSLNEHLMAHVFQEALGVEIPLPFPRLSYHQAMDRYGSERPDTRFGLELHELSKAFEGGAFKAFASVVASGGVVKGLLVPGALSRKDIESLTRLAKQHGAEGLAWARMEADGPSGGIAKFLPQGFMDGLEAKQGETLLLVAARYTVAAMALGAVRLALGKQLNLVKSGWNFLWVTDFPLLEQNAETGMFTYMHHPFTAPASEDLPLLDTDPGRMRALAYDMVLNGNEVGGGSIRIHQPDLQKKMFKVLGIGEAEAQEKFGFFLEALAYGAPPHGGIAWGLDRLLAIMVGADSIRDVIAFPKNQSGHDPLTDAPSMVSDMQLSEVGLRVIGE